jgi:transcriptional regulator with XRE-family HTH domain
MPKKRVYSKVTKEAARLLGKQIKLARKQRHWSETELAERAGVVRATVQKIERGSLNCLMGFVFEVATLVGLKLFDAEPDSLRRHLAQTDERIALLPKHTHHRKRKVDDEF